MTKIAGLAVKPDCIYTPMFTPDIGIFLKQLRAAGVTVPVLGADGDDQQALIDFAGADAEGLAFSTHGFASPGSDLEKLVADYTAWNGGKAPEANAFAGLGGDCIAIIKAAVEAAGSIDPKAIGDALANLENVKVDHRYHHLQRHRRRAHEDGVHRGRRERQVRPQGAVHPVVHPGSVSLGV